MAAKSPISPTIMEHPEEGSDEPTSPVNGMQEQLNSLTIQHDGSSDQEKRHQPLSSLTIHPTPCLSIQSPLISTSPLALPNNERSYLLENLQRQHQRGERLSHALSNVEVRLASVHSKSEAKRLRKEAGLLRSKITESQKQEQLVMLRLNDIQNEDLISRGGLFQAQSAGLVPYQTLWSPYSPMQPWGPMTLPIMSPVHPVSPLTPLPPGLYHPSPMLPSPMAPPYWLGAHHPFFGPVVTNDPSFYLGANFQPCWAPEVAFAAPATAAVLDAVETREHKHKRKATKSVDFSLSQQEAYTGRRWSLADAFSPTPRDKRMSMPGLQTIWKDKEQQEEWS